MKIARLLLFGIAIIPLFHTQALAPPNYKPGENPTSLRDKWNRTVRYPKASIKLRRNPNYYSYLRHILEGKNIQPDRYRKRGAGNVKIYAYLKATKTTQKFYKRYTPAEHLKTKHFYPGKQKVHYRNLFEKRK